jgi:hypothetical protein
MSSGSTVYVETPWGLFSQQQFMLLLSWQWALYNGADPAAATDAAYAFYSEAWPIIEAMDL